MGLPPIGMPLIALADGAELIPGMVIPDIGGAALGVAVLPVMPVMPVTPRRKRSRG
jgi:hypothetical protein